ncbi:MAG: hypothetical protein IJD13_08490, partial [Oscillospiraceae bacterium]|nr:hypothetical protein [Oscillospiraceae bacterium]
DERGCAQGLYQLEDRMNRIRAPYLSRGKIHFAPAFSPRMVHSGYGQEQYPEPHMSAIAHAGMDAILLFVKDVDLTEVGYMDFNNTIRRANKYGLDVYVYSKIESDRHPDDPDAFDHYNSTYGRLFEKCPGFKGVVLVGESVEFPSKDPRVSPFKYYNNTIDGLPTGKTTPGWFPCVDYPQWLKMLQRVIYPHRPDADIVFWTYNWGWAPEEERLALIDNLPEGISLMATFEMFNVHQMDGFKSRAADYTIAFPEAGPYFIGEARRAKERGIRLYTQANSAGKTWDYGVIPYEPVPERWVERYESMLEMKEKYGLSGVMESHHYGFWPNFISRIEKLMFTEPYASGEEALKAVAEELYGPENLEAALHAWHILSEAHTYYPITNEDQYGPFRVGPSYPFLLDSKVQIPKAFYSIYGGNKITEVDYAYSPAVNPLEIGFRQTRIDGEIRSLEKMRELQKQARQELEALAEKLSGIRRADCLRLCNMIAFMENTALTAIHAKKWTKLRWDFYHITEKDRMQSWVNEMTALAEAEIRNAEATIPLAEADSRLGWEPSMEYIGSVRHLRWKIRQVRLVIDTELKRYQKFVDETM